MPFNFATGQMEGSTPAPKAATPSAGGNGFNFATGQFGGSTPSALVESPVMKASTSPYKLSGPTELKAPVGNERGQIGTMINRIPVIGKPITAAFDTAKHAIDNTAEKLGSFFETLTAGEEQKSGLHALTNNKGDVDFTRTTGVTIGMTPQQREEYYTGLGEKAKPISKIVTGGSAAMSLVNFYPPIAQFNAELAAAKELPGPLSAPAKAVDWVFGKLSQAGSMGMNAIIDAVPESTMSSSTKEKVRPLAEELASFATLIVGTKIGFKTMEKGLGPKALDRLPISEKAKSNLQTGVKLGVGFTMAPFSTAYKMMGSMYAAKVAEREQANIKITEQENKKIADEIKKEFPGKYIAYQAKKNLIMEGGTEGKKSIYTPEYAKEQGYEGYKPEGELPTIEMGAKPKPAEETLPTIDFNAPEKTTEKFPPSKEMTYEPIKEPKAPRVSTEKITPSETVSEGTTPKVEGEIVKVSGEQLPVGEGKTKISRLEARLSDKLGRFTPEEAEKAGLSTFKQMSKKENIRKAAEFVDKNPEEALDVLKGKKDAPEGLTHGAIAITLSAHAEMEGNVALIRKLASLKATRMGQEISILSEADPFDVVDQATKIQIEREAKTSKIIGKKQSIEKTKTRLVEKGKKEVKTKEMKLKEAQSLLESLIC